MDKPAEIGTEDRQLIEQMICEYAYLLDHGQAAELPSMFTEDGALIGLGPDKRGQDAIAAWARQRGAMTERLSRHVQSNIRLQPVSKDVVAGTMILTVYRHDGGGTAPPVPLIVGEFDDLYERCADAQWRIKQRKLSVFFGDH